MAVVISSLPAMCAGSSKTVTVTDTKRCEILRQANMAAVRAVIDIIRTTLDQYRKIKSILKVQAFKNQCDIDMLCDTYPDFHDAIYRILSTKDKDNNQHAGATDSQINILPVSTIKGDRLEDACVICLETPAAGDMMRHLPCIHNFHKKCIDTWLRRKNACPLCKTAIT